MSVISGRVSAVVGHFEISLTPRFRDCVKTREPAQLEGRHSNTEPRADRGPQPGSPAGVVDATGCQSQQSEEHTSELQSPCNLVCRLLLEKKKNTNALRLLLPNL